MCVEAGFSQVQSHIWPDLPELSLWTHKLRNTFHQYLIAKCINYVTLQQCNTVNRLSVYFYCDWFLGPVRRPRVLEWSLNGYILPWQADSSLEIIRWLPSDFGHWFSYILQYAELKRASIDTIWLCSVLNSEEPATLWLPYHPNPPPHIQMCLWYWLGQKINYQKWWENQLAIYPRVDTLKDL